MGGEVQDQGEPEIPTVIWSPIYEVRMISRLLEIITQAFGLEIKDWGKFKLGLYWACGMV